MGYLTIYYGIISILLCLIEFFLVKKGKTDLAICVPIWVLVQSFSSGFNLVVLSLVLCFVMLATQKVIKNRNNKEDK